MRNFNEIFRKDVTYEILKITKNQGFTLSLENTFLKKPQRGVKLTPSLLRVNRDYWYSALSCKN